jgi:hypothetical protein
MRVVPSSSFSSSMRPTKAPAKQTENSGEERIPNKRQNETIICSPRSRLPEIDALDEQGFFGADALVEELSTSALFLEDRVPQGTILGTKSKYCVLGSATETPVMRTPALDSPCSSDSPLVPPPSLAPPGLFSRGDGGISSKFCPHSYINSTHIKILCKEDGKTMNLKI